MRKEPPPTSEAGTAPREERSTRQKVAHPCRPLRNPDRIALRHNPTERAARDCSLKQPNSFPDRHSVNMFERMMIDSRRRIALGALASLLAVGACKDERCVVSTTQYT